MAQPHKFILFPSTELHSGSLYHNNQQKFLLLSTIVAAFILRFIVCFFVTEQHVQRDTLEYFIHADLLLEGGYKNYFPNGYPFLIALSKIAGGSNFISVLLGLNILMSTATVYFTYDILQRITGNNRLALLGALLLGLFPTQLNYVRWILSEVPSTFFLVGFFFFYLRQRWFLSGLLIGFATITRTELGLVLLPILLYELFALKRVRIIMVAGYLIPVLLTAFYCYQKTGKFSLSGHGKVNILYSITASGGYVDWMYEEKHPEIKTSSEAMGLYFENMRENPGNYIKSRAANLWELWGFFPSSSEGNRKLTARVIIGLTNFFLVFFGLWGWWKQRKNYYASILLLPFCIVTIVHTALLALPRYTYAAEPFMIAFGCIALYPLLIKLKKLEK